jgi:NADH:ubiquinone oxidoreductase subunit F (NADH-binding)
METPHILLTLPRDAPPQDLAAYRETGGYEGLRCVLRDGPQALLGAIDDSKLRGRGGAAFPAGRKWRLAAEQPAGEKHVIANGGEHEPGSAKDRWLVERYPHAVLEGLLLCGFATGARQGWLYLIADMAAAIDSAERALGDLRAAGLLGERILGSDFSFEVRVHRAPATYVAGEETAAIDAIEGGPGKPRSKPPYPGQAGLFSKPTTVNNVETLAHAAWIARHGAAAFRAIGTEESTGTMLFTLGDEVERPGVHELPFGSTFRELIWGCGGGPRGGRAVRAILPALSCGFLGPEHLDTRIAHETLRPLGSSPGCGGVHLVLEGDDALGKVLQIAEFFQREQCGQCPPCRMATSQFAHVLRGVQSGVKGDFLGQMEKVAAFTRGQGKCSLIAMAAAPVLSAARLFHDDFAARARG